MRVNKLEKMHKVLIVTNITNVIFCHKYPTDMRQIIQVSLAHVYTGTQTRSYTYTLHIHTQHKKRHWKIIHTG